MILIWAKSLLVVMQLPHNLSWLKLCSELGTSLISVSTYPLWPIQLHLPAWGHVCSGCCASVFSRFLFYLPIYSSPIPSSFSVGALCLWFLPLVCFSKLSSMFRRISPWISKGTSELFFSLWYFYFGRKSTEVLKASKYTNNVLKWLIILLTNLRFWFGFFL